MSPQHLYPTATAQDLDATPVPQASGPPLVDTACSYWQAGLCPMPRVIGHVEPSYIDEQGEVRPIPWGQYKVKQPDWATVARWFAQSDLATVGMLLLTGSHAHPRADHTAFPQILDIETGDLFDAFQEDLIFAGHADIMHRCVIERTPSGGAHVGLCCRAIGDKQKMALAKCKSDQKILIELLQHQPCTVAPTQIRCKSEHPEGAIYQVVHGTWARPLEISAAQRQILLDAARVFNEVPEKTIRDRSEVSCDGARPGDRLNAHADAEWWQGLLTRHGWRDVSRPGLKAHGIYYFQRPGKVGREPSATYGKTGRSLYVFSSNAAPFDPDAAYSPFAAYTLLEHDSDFAKAAHALAEVFNMSHGAPPRSPFQVRQAGYRARIERAVAARRTRLAADPYFGSPGHLGHGIPTTVRREGFSDE